MFLTAYIFMAYLRVRIHMAALKGRAVLVNSFIQLFLLCRECSLKCQPEVPFTTVKVSLF